MSRMAIDVTQFGERFWDGRMVSQALRNMSYVKTAVWRCNVAVRERETVRIVGEPSGIAEDVSDR